MKTNIGILTEIFQRHINICDIKILICSWQTQTGTRKKFPCTSCSKIHKIWAEKVLLCNTVEKG